MSNVLIKITIFFLGPTNSSSVHEIAFLCYFWQCFRSGSSESGSRLLLNPVPVRIWRKIKVFYDNFLKFLIIIYEVPVSI
jgi:hypothetical protein